MPQRVNYEPLLSTRFDQYLYKLRQVLAGLKAPKGTEFRPFRDSVRKLGLWDKERSPVVFSLIDIEWDKKKVTVGKTARALAETKDDAAFQLVLYERLKEQNILLVKYVMEALDVESGGRLHSVHELYRMITSYVYPGEYVTLVGFQAWMDWIAATGYIKLVGIRWALSDKGKKEVSILRAMDLEEILEDMEDEADDDEQDDGEDEGTDAAEPADAFGSDAGFDDDEDLFADLPPEPEPPSEADIRAAQAKYASDFGDVAGTEESLPPVQPKPAKSRRQPRPAAPSLAQPAAPVAAVAMPAAGAAYARVASVSPDDPDVAALAARITGWHQALGDWPWYSAASLGAAPQEGASELSLIVELGVLAALIEGLSPQPQVFAFVKRLRNTTFFATLGHGEGLEEGLDALENTSKEPWARALFERLVHARFIARRVSKKIDLVPKLKSAPAGRAVIDALREHVTGPHFVEAPFWIARELVELGVIEAPKDRPALAVPTAGLRSAAAKIKLTSTAELPSFDDLFALSAEVTALFGSSAGWGRALEHLDRGLGLD